MNLQRVFLLGFYETTTNLNSVEFIGSDSSKQDFLPA